MLFTRAFVWGPKMTTCSSHLLQQYYFYMKFEVIHFAKAPLQEGKPNTPIYHNPSDFFYLRACHFDEDEVY